MLEIKKKYAAKVIDCGVSQTKDGSPQPYVKFELVDGAESAHITYFGSLKSEKSTTYCIKSLINCGFTGNDFEDLNKGTMIFAGNHKFTVELEHPQDKDGIAQTDKFRVKYINPASTGLTKFVGAIPKQTALFAQVKAELGIKKQTVQATKAETEW